MLKTLFATTFLISSFGLAVGVAQAQDKMEPEKKPMMMHHHHHHHHHMMMHHHHHHHHMHEKMMKEDKGM